MSSKVLLFLFNTFVMFLINFKRDHMLIVQTLLKQNTDFIVNVD